MRTYSNYSIKLGKKFVVADTKVSPDSTVLSWGSGDSLGTVNVLNLGYNAEAQFNPSINFKEHRTTNHNILINFNDCLRNNKNGNKNE